MSRAVTVALAVIVLVVGVAVGIGAGLMVQSSSSGQTAAATAAPTPTAGPTDAPGPTLAPEPTPTLAPEPTPEPTATPEPTPVTFAAPLDGVPVSEKLARRHIIAVMIDDQFEARPQSGLSRASQVWQAPAEGGIPRYMALFGEQDPPSVGPIRSARLYFIAWASEWRSTYVHAGGSPQAIALLSTSAGRGKYVYNADVLRGSHKYSHRIHTRLAPHNVYTDAKNLQKMSKARGAKPYDPVPEPVWRFAPDAPLDMRPKGSKLIVPYPANLITYTYDRVNNRYLRAVSHEGKQVDAGTKERIAPKNVVVIVVGFVPTGDHKGRLDAQLTGTGRAWISTNGVTVKGTWKKRAFNSPTLLFGPDGKPATLTIGQTFVQVVPKRTTITFKNGKVPAPAVSPSPSPSPTPSGTTGLLGWHAA